MWEKESREKSEQRDVWRSDIYYVVVSDSSGVVLFSGSNLTLATQVAKKNQPCSLYHLTVSKTTIYRQNQKED
jgi:hypothetical protein